MKNVILMCMVLTVSSALFGQDTSANVQMTGKSVNGISFKRAFIDYKSANAGSIQNFGSFREFSSGFELGYLRDFTDNLRLYIPLRIGVFNLSDQNENVTFGELDAQLQYRFNTKKGILRPYLLLGAGVNTENLDTFNVQIPMGAGLDIRIAKKTFVNFQAEYRLSLSDQRNNNQFSLGFIHFFGKSNKTTPAEPKVSPSRIKDSDGDGVQDDLDLCPTKFGLKQFAGCPDTDGDGLEDTRDQCPEIPGIKALNGCPDTDGDGVADKDDDCPNLAGTKANRGCPSTDTDNDGVIDDLDECPTIAGSPAAKGCPDRDGDGVADRADKCPNIAGKSKNGCPDTDGDGVDDGEDRCPTTFGPATNKGCPEIKKEDSEILNIAMRDVQFEHNSAKLRSDSYRILDQISQILNRYPEYKIEISGHTDNTGTAELNKKFSEQRARACRDYLISKGLTWSRVASRGFGQTKPIATNETPQGRATNRRVEFKLFLE
ncbi:MAG: OmpA family protein [Saprospiraceae bacterium]|nr:OmpA family protein [Saprospiraceae bacterium]